MKLGALVAAVVLCVPLLASGQLTPRRALPETWATRVAPLYYQRDADRVIALVRGSLRTPADRAEPPAVQASDLEAELARLQAERAELLAPPVAGGDGVIAAAYQGPSHDGAAAGSLQRLDAQIAALQRHAAATGGVGAWAAAEAPPAPSDAAIEHVQLQAVGEGRIHLRGPLEGVNSVARMIHEIDQPVGEVKIGIHVVQFSVADAEANVGLQHVRGLADGYLTRARRLSQTSQDLFHAALANVAARRRQSHPDRPEDALFYGPCVENFRELHGSPQAISLSVLDGRDIVTTLFLAGLTTGETRREIVDEFRRLARETLPPIYEEHSRQVASAAKKAPVTSFSATAWNPFRGRTPAADDVAAASPSLEWTFPRTCDALALHGSQSAAATPLQIATARYQRALIKLRRCETRVAQLRNERLLLTLAPQRDRSGLLAAELADRGVDFATFAELADHVIAQQAAEVVDAREALRAEAAVLDAQLKRLASAFEEDVRQQFYQQSLSDLRADCSLRKVSMGQLQTTTIRTSDRTPARVSPGQVAVVDRPSSSVLLAEGLQVAEGVAHEVRATAQAAAWEAANDALAPGAALLPVPLQARTAPGEHLNALARGGRLAVSVGDDIAITPIIQPDGCSVAFHLRYAHAPQRSGAGAADQSRVERHLVEAEVHLPSLELREVSRFRVALNADAAQRGVPLLEDLPGVGALFRPRASTASATQENLILADAVVYPTVFSLIGKFGLAIDERVGQDATYAQEAHDELTAWVVQTLRRQADAGGLGPAPARDARRGTGAAGLTEATAPATHLDGAAYPLGDRLRERATAANDAAPR